MATEVGVVSFITADGRPFPPEPNFISEGLRADDIRIEVASSCGLQVAKLGVGCDQIPFTQFSDAQAKIEVIACDREGFVHPAYCLVNAAPHGGASGDQRADNVHATQTVINAAEATRISNIGPIRSAIQAQHDARMLYGAVGIVEDGTY